MWNKSCKDGYITMIFPFSFSSSQQSKNEYINKLKHSQKDTILTNKIYGNHVHNLRNVSGTSQYLVNWKNNQQNNGNLSRVIYCVQVIMLVLFVNKSCEEKYKNQTIRTEESLNSKVDEVQGTYAILNTIYFHTPREINLAQVWRETKNQAIEN